MLKQAGAGSPEFDSKALCSFLTGLTLGELPLHYGDTVSVEASAFYALIKRRAAGEPLQYITGEQEFMGYVFKVDPRVLIPRLDTEILVETVLKKAEGLTGNAASPGRAFRVLDLCTGSGAIGLSIYMELKAGSPLEVTLSDIDAGALTVAKKNTERLCPGGHVRIVESDLYAALGKERFDIIVSNPPYIPTDVIGTLGEDVKDHEPSRALDGGADGLDFYRRIIDGAAEHLYSPAGILALEIGFDQAESVCSLIEKTGAFFDIMVTKDLAGNDRVVTAVRKL